MAQPFLIMCFLSLMLFANGIPFDFYQLVQQWGPNYCNSTSLPKCYTLPQPRFTIHGLWPSNYTQLRLRCTGNTTFGQITGLESQLIKNWPDIKNGKDQDFWKHEWKKHGECIDPPFTTFGYFDISLNLQKKYDLLAILKAAGLSPRMSKGLVVQDILSPIENVTGKKPGIHCNKNGKTRQWQLFEIVLCYDNNQAISIIDCPDSVNDSCKFQPTFVWLLPQ